MVHPTKWSNELQKMKEATYSLGSKDRVSGVAPRTLGSLSPRGQGFTPCVGIPDQYYYNLGYFQKEIKAGAFDGPSS